MSTDLGSSLPGGHCLVGWQGGKPLPRPGKAWIWPWSRLPVTPSSPPCFWRLEATWGPTGWMWRPLGYSTCFSLPWGTPQANTGPCPHTGSLESPRDDTRGRQFVLLPTTEVVPHSGARCGWWRPLEPLDQSLPKAGVGQGGVTGCRRGHVCSKANAGSFASVNCTYWGTDCS